MVKNFPTPEEIARLITDDIHINNGIILEARPASVGGFAALGALGALGLGGSNAAEPPEKTPVGAVNPFKAEDVEDLRIEATKADRRYIADQVKLRNALIDAIKAARDRAIDLGNAAYVDELNKKLERYSSGPIELPPAARQRGFETEYQNALRQLRTNYIENLRNLKSKVQNSDRELATEIGQKIMELNTQSAPAKKIEQEKKAEPSPVDRILGKWIANDGTGYEFSKHNNSIVVIENSKKYGVNASMGFTRKDDYLLFKWYSSSILVLNLKTMILECNYNKVPWGEIPTGAPQWSRPLRRMND